MNEFYTSIPVMTRKTGKTRLYMMMLSRWKFDQLLSSCSHSALLFIEDHSRTSDWIALKDGFDKYFGPKSAAARVSAQRLEKINERLRLKSFNKPLTSANH